MIIKIQIIKTCHRSLQRAPQTIGLLLEKPLLKSESLLKPEEEFSAVEFEEGEFTTGEFIAEEFFLLELFGHPYINVDRILFLEGWII